MATITQRLDDIITPIVTELGLELFDLEFASSTVRVTIDKAPVDGRPGVIDLGDITAVTRAVSRALDEHDPIVERYSLEVSSPGLERTLRTPVHFERAVGQLVSVKTVPGSVGERRLKGTLSRAGAVGAVTDPLETGDAGEGADPQAPVDPASSIDVVVDGEVHTIAYADIDKARTVFEWGPEARPSKPKTKPAAKTKSASKAAAGSGAAESKQPKPKKKKVNAT